MATSSEQIFYDGECGLCHRWVLFTLKHERGRALFRFAPLQGPTFAESVSASERAALPDSVAVRTADGRLLVRSDGALHVFTRLGGVWRALAVVARVLPLPLRDWGYDRIASVRKKLFAKPATACPMVPRELASRFDP